MNYRSWLAKILQEHAEKKTKKKNTTRTTFATEYYINIHLLTVYRHWHWTRDRVFAPGFAHTRCHDATPINRRLLLEFSECNEDFVTFTNPESSHRTNTAAAKRPGENLYDNYLLATLSFLVPRMGGDRYIGA